MYKALIRPVLFLFSPESIHHFIFWVLHLKFKVPGIKSLARALFVYDHPQLERKILGLTFKNPVGLAAGFDKDGKLIDELACFGFGFIEIGTITPRPQPGNEKPRLFRLPKDQALINRMGFNNQGVVSAVEKLKRRKSGIVVGGNIGKNKTTPNEQAVEDYLECFEALYPYVDYFVVNVSSPNTPGLRELQEREPLKKLLTSIRSLNQQKEKPKPILLKIAPDLTTEQLADVIVILKETKTDGVIATNTTVSREGLTTPEEVVKSIGPGGLSGRPLQSKSLGVIRSLRNQLGPDYPIIGVGGIMTPDDAMAHLDAGANLVQLYTGFVYEGPSFVKRICKSLTGQ